MTEERTNPEAVEPETQAAEEPTQEPQAEPSQEDATFLRKELDRARKEAARYRTSLREKEEAEQKAAEEKRKAEQSAEERAKELEAKLTEAEKAAEERVRLAEVRAELAGQVTNPKRLLALMQAEGTLDQHLSDDGVDVAGILEAYPEYAPAKTNVGGSSRPNNNEESGALTQADFKGKSAEWINANIHRLK